MNQKNQKNIVLQAALAACFGVAASQAGAVVNLSTSTTPIKFASELTTPVALTNNGNAMSVSLDNVTGLNVGVTPLVLQFDLTGGAVFSSDPTLTCLIKDVYTALYVPVGASVAGSKNVGGATTSTVTFTITTAAAWAAATAAVATATPTQATTTGQCTLSGFSGVSASDQVSKGISATLSYAIGGITTTTTRAATTFITFNKGVSASVAAPATAILIDGTNSFAKFVSGSNYTTALSNLGTIAYASVGGITNADGATVTLPSSVATASTIAVSGASLAAATGVYLVSAGGLCDTASPIATQTALANSVTFTAQTIANVSAGIQVCMSVGTANTTAISESQITVTLTPGAATGYTPNVTGGSGNLANITNNGQTRNAWMINAAASTNKTSVVRIINKSGLTGAIKGTLYAEDGSVLGTANTTVATFTSTGQQMATLTSADIETLFGTTLAATAKASLKVFSPIGNVEILNFTKDIATGSLSLTNTGTTSSN